MEQIWATPPTGLRMRGARRGKDLPRLTLRPVLIRRANVLRGVARCLERGHAANPEPHVTPPGEPPSLRCGSGASVVRSRCCFRPLGRRRRSARVAVCPSSEAAGSRGCDGAARLDATTSGQAAAKKGATPCPTALQNGRPRPGQRGLPRRKRRH